MDVGLLVKLFGSTQEWSAACTIIVDGEATIQNAGADSAGGAGAKFYAPRLITGRINADAACLLKDGSAMVMVQQQRVRQHTGEDILKQTLTVVDSKHVIGAEFTDTAPMALKALGLDPPATRSGSSSGVFSRPKIS